MGNRWAQALSPSSRAAVTPHDPDKNKRTERRSRATPKLHPTETTTTTTPSRTHDPYDTQKHVSHTDTTNVYSHRHTRTHSLKKKNMKIEGKHNHRRRQQSLHTLPHLHTPTSQTDTSLLPNKRKSNPQVGNSAVNIQTSSRDVHSAVTH